MTPTSPGPRGGAAEPFVLIVRQGDHTLLRLDGTDLRMDRLLLADQRRLLAVLAQTMVAVIAHQPDVSPLVGAVDAVEALAALQKQPALDEAIGRIFVAAYEAQDAATGSTKPTLLN